MKQDTKTEARGYAVSNNSLAVLEDHAFKVENRGSVSILEDDDPMALINLVTPKVRERIQKAVEARPDLFDLDERSLKQKLKSKPNSTDNRMRVSLWQAYELVQEGRKKSVEAIDIYAGTCSKAYFFSRYMETPEKVAWLVNPPVCYTAFMEEALLFGMEQLREILALPNRTKKTGAVNGSLVNLKTRIVGMLLDRVKGPVAQRIEKKSMNVQLTPSQKEKMNAVMLGDKMARIDQKIKKLEAKERGEVLADEEEKVEGFVLNADEREGVVEVDGHTVTDAEAPEGETQKSPPGEAAPVQDEG